MSSELVAERERVDNRVASPFETVVAIPRVSVQEYFVLERASSIRHEYVDGEIQAMSGETPNHNIIAGNVYVRLRLALDGRPCQSFIENIRVRVTPTRYRYPDVTALCGEAHFDEQNPPALLNPVVVVEVLSPSTTHIDLGEKFIEYRRLETVRDYILVAQDQVEVTHYARQSEGRWLVSIYNGLEDVLTISSVDVSLTLSDIYRQIIFPIPTVPEAQAP